MKTPRRADPLPGIHDAAPAGLRAPFARIGRAWAAWRGARVLPAPLVEELEARLLYSADPAGAGLALAGTVIEQRVVDDSGDFIQATAAEPRNHELLIVGAGVADARTLLDGLARDGRDIEVLQLDPAADSIGQISAALAGRHDLAAIHILSHGDSGALQLGADTIDAGALAARAGEVGRWGDALGADGDILLYGCDVAAGDAGAAFVRQLSALTGADVAASDNLTGDSSLQADWTLEVSTGRIGSTAAFSAAAQAQWHGTLEIRVNTVTQDKQHEAAVAVSPSGSFVVTWTADHDQDGDKTGIFAQRFDASGKPAGGQILVNTATQDRQEMSTVGTAADGSFVVAWASRNHEAGDTDGWSVKGQRFAADGSRLGAEFLVNQLSAKDQWQPSIAVAADGQFVIAWTSSAGNDIYVRHFDAAGNPLGGEVLASSVNGAGSQTLPSVAIAADGSYVVAWQTDSGGTAKSVYAQRFNADDSLRGSGFKANTHDADDQTQPSVAISGSGTFVIAWTSAKQDGDAGGIYAQLYGSDGERAGSEFRVNTVTAKDQGDASVAMDGAGNFTVAWNSVGQDNGGSPGIYAQRYSVGGAALGGAFLVNSTTAATQTAPAVSVNGGGNLAIAWEGAGIGDSDGVFVAVYNVANAPPTANPDSVSLLQGGQASSAAPGVLANDTDPDSDATLAVAGLLSPVDGSMLGVTAAGVSVDGIYGTLLLRADGSYIYSAGSDAARALAAGQVGSDVFSYIVSDNNTANASSTLTFTVTGLNDAPVAGNDAYAVNRQDNLGVPAGGVLANDGDADRNPADPMTVVSVNGSAAAVGAYVTGQYGMLRVDADGALSYVPDGLNLTLTMLLAGESATDSFTYEVSDGRGGVASATIRVTILATNAAPVALDDGGPNYTLQQDGSLAAGAATGVLANDNDPDNNTLTAQLVSGPAHGALQFNPDGSFVYTPNANYYGADSFSYRASDGSLASAVATATLNIVHVNHAPTAGDDSAAVTAGGATAADAAHGLLANDGDIDPADQPTVSTVQYGDQMITLTPGGNGSLVTDYGTLYVGSDGAFSYVADGAASMRVGQSAVTGESFLYTISDGQGGTSTAWLSIDIAGVNDAPVITVSAGAGQAVSDSGALQPFTGVSITDIDSPAQQLLVQIALDDPGKGTLSSTQGGSYDAARGVYAFSGSAAEATAVVNALMFRPAPNRVTPGWVDTTRFTITASDGLSVASDSSTTVESTSVNDAPSITGSVPAQAV
ncbi:MAG: Ig-like domain-containing protein, partial [Noviherbaspirillum sp.]